MVMGWRASASEKGVANSAPFNAPLFRGLIDDFEMQDRWVVLDLGAARAQTIALFGNNTCRLDIADIADGLDTLNSLEESKALIDNAEALLPKRRNEPTDIIFCWDILNYLERPALGAVMSRIAARARPGALAHALIVYSETHMPEAPGTYVPQPDNSLVKLAATPETRLAPRYSPDDLNQCMPDYAIERAMLLSNGMQEFLFRL